MSSSQGKTAAELFDDFIKLEWQDIFRMEIDVRLDSVTRYVPNSGPRGVQLLRKDVNAFEEAIRLWSGPVDQLDSGTKGYDRIVEQAGVRYTWEWFLIDPARPWASSVPALVRERIAADLDRRNQRVQRRAQEKDEVVIASMNAKRAADGREPLDERQEASVRDNLRPRRDKRA